MVLRPVHSADELAPLMSRFPDNIKLFASYKQDSYAGGNNNF